jgi:hypothetical protein
MDNPKKSFPLVLAWTTLAHLWVLSFIITNPTTIYGIELADEADRTSGFGILGGATFAPVSIGLPVHLFGFIHLFILQRDLYKSNFPT